MNNKINIKDIEVLTEFQNQLDSLNNKAIELLDKFNLLFEDMDTGWSGRAANGFKNNYQELVKEVKDNHTEMMNRDKILGLIAEDVIELDKAFDVEEI